MRGASATAQKLQTGRHEQPGWRTELQAAKNTLHAAQAAHPSRQAARPVVIGGCDDGDEFTEPLVTKAAFEAAWGGCHRSGWRSVLVALPYSADMLCDLQVLMFTNLKSLECANEGFNLHLGLYDKPYQNDMDARKTKKSGRGVLATLRNALLQEYLRPEHEYVLWLDADVVEYPPDLVGQLHGLNPGGVSAPLVLIEDSDTERFHSPAPSHAPPSTSWASRKPLTDACARQSTSATTRSAIWGCRKPRARSSSGPTSATTSSTTVPPSSLPTPTSRTTVPSLATLCPFRRTLAAWRAGPQHSPPAPWPASRWAPSTCELPPMLFA